MLAVCDLSVTAKTQFMGNKARWKLHKMVVALLQFIDGTRPLLIVTLGGIA